MGASSSTDHVSEEQKEVESLAASTGSLPMLKNVFSKLCNPSTSTIPLESLQECFSLSFTNVLTEGTPMPACFPELLAHLGPTIADQFFVSNKGGIVWVDFLRGYVRCCGRVSSSISLKTLYKVYAAVCVKVGLPLKLEFESDEPDSKISGSLLPSDIFMLLWTCWIMSITKITKNDGVILPDIKNLVLAAIQSCTVATGDLTEAAWEVSTTQEPVPAPKLHVWALTTVPGLAHCLSQFIHDRLQKCATSMGNSEPPVAPPDETFSMETREHDTCLLTCGTAWAISLSLGSAFRSELFLKACCPGKRMGVFEDLLYRSSLHGKGLNRFWFGVDGYNAPLLILISASSSATDKGDVHAEQWVIGVLAQGGFENRNSFYGSSGNLYAIKPIFHVFPPSGKDKNFVYSHLHTAGRVYEPRPKPVGIAFGGTVGNERIFIDEDFSRVTIRHHAVDKTYQPGPLFPSQGFLPTEASVLEVEVWGLGGKTAKSQLEAYKKREDLFSEQRRKVDLTKFASWEDSPEKMMMDMMADPNSVQREDR
ncbi:uncharacterized protein [Aristolochia californica]|uniref:uncharacterized protein n=1 Tax=Aristolochia californica TaxID=171875 RepID=UPI0035D83BDB